MVLECFLAEAVACTGVSAAVKVAYTKGGSLVNGGALEGRGAKARPGWKDVVRPLMIHRLHCC